MAEFGFDEEETTVTRSELHELRDGLSRGIAVEVCAEAGCLRAAKARGLCLWHYDLARYHRRLPVRDVDPLLSDEELVEVARHVARDARPLFALAMAWCIRQGLLADEREPA